MRGERTDLAPYAAKSVLSRGREHKEALKDNRPAFERDRDRVIHCAAFRRLEYKTQVFVNHEGDYYRTRLTHSLEVAQIARGLARRLGLNEELSEALALAHDLGHTPFGHTGEDVLDSLMKDYGGFEHNLQGHRVVTLLEKRHPDFDGLNLTWEVREGIVKHSSSWDSPDIIAAEGYDPERQPLLEAQIIDFADEIAYNNHDIDDGLEAGYITGEELLEVPLWREVTEAVERAMPSIDGPAKVSQTISYLIGVMMADLVDETTSAISAAGIISPEEVGGAGRLVKRSSKMEEKNRELKEFLYNSLYRHPKVETMRFKAESILTALFSACIENPGLLPRSLSASVERWGLERTVCDMIASMTDRECIEEHSRLFDPYRKV
ncbi:MAG: deoxyguanosinetriphosphate triphosphohydrolase [Deltaproteobacteria bacterium]|nr:MAG: deoxyguanosinetriphosphate triphosphohydrolase [Deltaproteobacteria bacterium]